MYRRVAQKWVVFAFDETTGIEESGLTLTTLTANLRIDGGAANAVDDTNPVELEDGYYIFDITAAESDGEMITIAPACSVAEIQVVGSPATQHTFTNIISGLVDAGGSATSVPSSLNTTHSLSTYDAMNGRVLIFDPATTTAGLRNVAGTITDYNGGNGTLTFAAGTWTASCVSGDTFKIY